MELDNGDLLKRLRKEEANRKDQPIEVALASKMKKGGEATLSGAGPKKGQKKGTPFPLPIGNEIICRSGDRYKIEASITEYIMVVRSKATQRLYGTKIEWLQDEKGSKQLIREIHVLSDATKHEPRFARHFPRLLNKGRVAKCFNFLVMTLGDMNLNELRNITLKNYDFSRRDAGRLSMQTFQAVHDLHTLGYLHRNLSPTKFVLAIDNPQIVYIIDFSRSHHFEQHYDNKPRGSPRRLPKLKERTYLSRNYHRNKDIQRKDDLESWIYLCFNLFGRQLLPWNEQFSDVNMMVNKEHDQCYKYVPRQFLTIMNNLDKHEDKQRPDYTFIGMTLVAMKESLKFHLTGPFDFQKKPHKKLPQAPTVEEKEKHEKEKQAALAVVDSKKEVPAPPPVQQSSKTPKKRKVIKDIEASKTTPNRIQIPNPANLTRRLLTKLHTRLHQLRVPNIKATKRRRAFARKKEDEKERARKEKEETAAKLLAARKEEAIERERKETEDLANKLAKIEEQKAQAEIERERKEKEQLVAKLNAQKAEQKDAELERIRCEKKELETQLLAAKDEGKTQEQREQVCKEKEQMLAKMTELEIEQSHAKIERERQEKEQLAQKIANARAEKAKAALEREIREKEEMAAKLAEIEAQTKREEAEAAAKTNKPQTPKDDTQNSAGLQKSAYFSVYP
ncbi:Protein kinase domain-containing protein [Aphelenchoides besseyi]|nr:Protein kinase domain-containing protein [Aphelenchoides besseyi]